MLYRGNPASIDPAGLKAYRSFLASGQLPGQLQDLVEGYLSAKTGRPFGDKIILDRLRRAIVAQKSGYWKEGRRREISYRAGYSVLAYLAYQFPVYFFQSCHLIGWLAEAGRLGTDMLIVDLGTGPGVVPLAFLTFGRYLPDFSAEVVPVEPSEEHWEACRYLVNGYHSPDDRVHIHPALRMDVSNVETSSGPSEIDLLVLSNLLNELPGDAGQRADVVRRWTNNLAEGGMVLLVEPADLANSTALRDVQRELIGLGLHLHYPCRHLWGSGCGPVQCWSFEERPMIRPTRLQDALVAGSRDGYRYRNTDIKFSAALFGRDRPPRADCVDVDRRRLVPLSHLHRHVGRRISCMAALMSNDLGDARTHMFKICDGTARRPVFAVLPFYHETKENNALLRGLYGDAVVFRDVLVRENQKTRAFNLLVSRFSQVSPCGA